MKSLSLVAQIPIERDHPIHTNHPLLSRHREVLDHEAHLMWEEAAVHQVNLSEDGGLFHIYLIPTTEHKGMLLAWDMSGIARFTRRIHQTLVHSYRDVLYAATEGRLLLVDPVEVSEQLGEPIAELTHPIRTPGDIGACRTLAMKVLREAGLPPQIVLEFALSVSEAVTNTLQHSQGGEFRLVRLADGWTAVVSDRGAGIDLTQLPHFTLLRGYSTKPSLGLGFTAMLRCLDRLVIASSDQGTTLLLQKFETDHVEAEVLDRE